MTYKLSLPIMNHSNRKLLVVIEPWAEFYTLDPHESLEIIGEGGKIGDNFSIEYNKRYVSIHAWPGSIANAYRNGMELEPEEQIFPTEDQ